MPDTDVSPQRPMQQPLAVRAKTASMKDRIGNSPTRQKLQAVAVANRGQDKGRQSTGLVVVENPGMDMGKPQDDITRLLARWQDADDSARQQLMVLIYPELKKIAGRALSLRPPQATLQTTDLVNDAYLKLVDQRNMNWRNRSHFFAIAARLIRRIIVDYSRKRLSDKRGGHVPKVNVDDVPIAVKRQVTTWLALDEALTRLAAINPQAAQVVELRQIVGLTVEESADVMNIGTATVGRLWRFARAWLQIELSDQTTLAAAARSRTSGASGEHHTSQ